MLAINRYDEYGIPQGSNAGRFQYTGQAWLPELGLYYYKARMYSPTLGRFMQTDPIGYGDGMNWYNYVKSDPVNSKDPSGLFASGQEMCSSQLWGQYWEYEDGTRILAPQTVHERTICLPAFASISGIKQDSVGGLPGDIVVTANASAKKQRWPSPPPGDKGVFVCGIGIPPCQTVSTLWYCGQMRDRKAYLEGLAVLIGGLGGAAAGWESRVGVRVVSYGTAVVAGDYLGTLLDLKLYCGGS